MSLAFGWSMFLQFFLNFTAWFPSKPRIMSMNNITGLVEIAFVVPSDYNITSFELRLITYSQESSIANMTSEIFKATKVGLVFIILFAHGDKQRIVFLLLSLNKDILRCF